MRRLNIRSVLLWTGIYSVMFFGVAIAEMGSLSLWMALAFVGLAAIAAVIVDFMLGMFGWLDDGPRDVEGGQ